MMIDTLSANGIQQPLLYAWKNVGIETLTECQSRVLSHQPLWAGRNTLVVAPTSSGKTFVGEVLAAKSASSLKRAIFLVPFKAIAEEKYEEFRERYKPLGISVVISDGDHTRFDRDIRRGDFGIAVIVYEKMAQLLIQSPGILVNCSLIVVDEIQTIADRTRGPSLEILLTYIRQLEEQPQIIGLSATMSNLGGLDSWLDADVVDCQERPVPLWEGIAFHSGSTELENVETKERKPGLEFSSVVAPHSSWSHGSKLDIAYKILMMEGLTNQFLVFRTRVDDTIATARELAHVLPASPVEPDVRSRIGDLEETRARDFLSQWIDKRVAYHNAGLSLQERRLIEQLYREGVIRVLVTTSTLAAGVNTPSDVVIMLDYKRYDFDQRTNVPIPVEEYRNSVGRAGRFGIATEGRSYLIAENPGEEMLLGSNYLHGRTRSIRSSIPNSGDAGVLTLKLLSLGLLASETDLRESIRHSFAFNQYFDKDEDRDIFLGMFTDSLEELQSNGLTHTDTKGLSVTDLGTVASSSGMSLDSFHELLRSLKALEGHEGDVSLLSRLCHLSEFSPLRPYDTDDKASVLNDWITGRPTSHIINDYSSRYEIGSGHIKNIGDMAAWMLTTAAHIASIPDVLAEGETVSQALTGLAHRCKYGVPGAVVAVAELGVLDRPELNILINNSTGKVLDTPHKILDTPLSEFVGILSSQRAKALQSAILDQIGESVSGRRFGHVARADSFKDLKRLVERCYDLQGTDLEMALEELLDSYFPQLRVYRFGNQRTGQPDLEVTGTRGTIVIEVTASADDKKPINWRKAREVMSSVGYSGQASNFVTIGRPGFHDVAVGNANEFAARGDRQLLLIALPEFIEVCLSEIESRAPTGSLLKVLENARGHFLAETVEPSQDKVE